MRSLTVKLLAFNLLLVFLPIGSLLYLDTYEKQLLQNLERSLIQQGRIFSAALSDTDSGEQTGGIVAGGSMIPEHNSDILRQHALLILENLNQNLIARVRIVDMNGVLLADSAVDFQHSGASGSDVSGVRSATTVSKITEAADEIRIRDSLPYQIAVEPIKAILRLLYPPRPPLPSGEYYSGKEVLLGDEIEAALEGRYGAATRISSGGQRSVNLYSALPIYSGELVAGAVLVNQSTYRILSNLYGIRMDIINIFFLSLTAAFGLSVLLSLTITRPIRKLQHEAEQVLDDNGAVRDAFSKLRRRDEIGSLSRSLNTLAGRLVKRIDFIDSFYSDILHELKNPLTAVRSAAEIMESDSPDWQRPFLRTIQEETNRINRILGELRELTRIDTQLDVEETEPIDISPFVMELIDGYGRLHRENLRIAAGRMDDRCLVEANPARLRQVLVNLFDNALSFSKSAAHSPALIQVEVLRRGRSEKERARYAEIIIEDNGPGISPGNLDRIFDRFFTDREDRDDHSGLGLSICKAIVEGYGGTIRAANRKEGGARFSIGLDLKK